MNNIFPEHLYRSDQTFLQYTEFFYQDRNEYWIGYFDFENDGWVEAITAINSNRDQAILELDTKIKNTNKYFKNISDINLNLEYDKTVIYDGTKKSF